MFAISVLAIGLVGGVALLETIVRRTDVGAVAVFAVLLVGDVTPIPLDVAIGPVRVGPNDLLFLVLTTAAIARLLRSERHTVGQWLLVALAALVVYSVLRGVGEAGAAAAINQARKFLFFTGTALYFSTVEPRRDLFDRLGRLWLWAAAVHGVVALTRWALDVVGVTTSFWEGDGTLRVLPAASALFLAQGAIIALPTLLDRRSRWQRWAAPVLLALVVVLQHRTVWLLTAVAVLYLLFRQRALAPRLLAALGAVLAVVALLSFTVLDRGGDELTEELATSARDTGTFEWRVEGWRTLVVAADPDLEELLTGAPFGRSWERQMYGTTVDVSPHSFYVEPYLRIGALGLVTVLAAYAVAIRGTHRRSRLDEHEHGPPGLLEPHVLHVLVTVQLLYYVTYTPDEHQGALLGLALAAAAPALADRRRRTVEVAA